MREIRTVEDFARVVLESETLADLWHGALDYFHFHDFPMVSYHHTPRLGGSNSETRVYADGFPEDWLCHYIENELYLVNPIPRFAEQTSKPFLWSEVPALKELLTAEEGYIQEVLESPVGEGLAIQVFGPQMRNGYVGIGFGGRSRRLDPVEILELQCVCQMAHLRYCDLIMEQTVDHMDLSDREREILGWIAKGKSNAVIADILGVSSHTVDTHVRRIFAKLDVQDRITAAIRGLGSGLITGVS